ncbi:MAG: ribonuclease HI family protein [Vicinamibacterales bacterium]
MITAFIDGGARGNPGPAGYGVYIVDAQGLPIAKLHGALGEATNNVAEYNGLLAALEWAADRGHTRVHIKADSQLLVEQMNGNYRVKNEGLVPLYRTATQLVARIGNVTFEHIPREQNQEADRLSNLGMDEN